MVQTRIKGIIYMDNTFIDTVSTANDSSEYYLEMSTED